MARVWYDILLANGTFSGRNWYALGDKCADEVSKRNLAEISPHFSRVAPGDLIQINQVHLLDERYFDVPITENLKQV
jgi:hypothetical protein